MGQASAKDVLKASEVENLMILPSNIELTGSEVELVNEIGRESRLKRALQPLREEYDFVIIDCPPSLGLLTINALTAAHTVLVPIQCEYYAMEGLGQLLKTITLVKENLNEGLDIEGILLTMADYRTNLTEQVVREIRSHFGAKVYRTIIPRSIKMGEAPGFGKPIMLYDRSCVGCKKYEEFTNEFMENNVTQQQQMS
jgi:chromosome partitioning protein